MKNIPFYSLDDLKLFFQDSKFKKIQLICGKKSFSKSGAEQLISKVLKNKKIYFYFKKAPFPDFIELVQIIQSVKKNRPDLILAIGGGSVIDYAKIVNVFAEDFNEKELKSKILNSNYKIKKKFSHLAVIPTTAGSGAEVTSNAVIYIENTKYSVEAKELRPDNFFLVPNLILKGNHTIKASAGFDAIAQALESIISKKSNTKSLFYAKKSLELSLNNFTNYIKKPNLINTKAMCLASNLSGEAINISKTTAPHAVSYPFTSFYGISHGHAVSLTLNKFLVFNYLNIKHANCDFDLKERYNIIFKLTKTNNIVSLEEYLKNLKKQTNLEDNFFKLGINIKEDFNKIISGVNSARLSNNPVNLNKKDIKEIICK